MRTVKSGLKRLLIEHPKLEWDRLITATVFASNILANRSTGYSPFYLLFGRSPIIPGYPVDKEITGTIEDDDMLE